MAVGSGWRLAVGGGWRLAVGGWWSLGAVLTKKNSGFLRTALHGRRTPAPKYCVSCSCVMMMLNSDSKYTTVVGLLSRSVDTRAKRRGISGECSTWPRVFESAGSGRVMRLRRAFVAIKWAWAAEGRPWMERLWPGRRVVCWVVELSFSEAPLQATATSLRPQA